MNFVTDSGTLAPKPFCSPLLGQLPAHSLLVLIKFSSKGHLWKRDPVLPSCLPEPLSRETVLSPPRGPPCVCRLPCYTGDPHLQPRCEQRVLGRGASPGQWECPCPGLLRTRRTHRAEEATRPGALRGPRAPTLTIISRGPRLPPCPLRLSACIWKSEGIRAPAPPVIGRRY